MTLGEYIAQQVREALDGAVKDSKGDLTDIAVAGGKAAHGGILGDVESIVDIVTNVLTDIPIIGGLLKTAEQDVLGPVAGLANMEKGVNSWTKVFSHGYLIGFAAYQLLKPVFDPLVHELNSLVTTEVFDPLTAAQLASKGIITKAFAESEAAGGNLDGAHEDALIEGQYNWPALTEVLDLVNRGEMTGADAATVLTRGGVPPQYIAQLLSLGNKLLSPADLGLAVLRRTITQDQATALAARDGYSASDMDLILKNIGEPPGTMQLLEAYRRGFIDQTTLETGILQSRVRDEWIPVIEKLRYSPMTVADAVRAVVENYMTDAEGADIAQQNGLEPAHWSYLVESWGRPIAIGEMLELLNRGLVTEDQVKQAIRESDVKDKYVDTYLGLRRRLVPEYQIVNMIKDAAITNDQALKMLAEQGYNRADSEAFLKLGAAKATTPHHTLDKSDTIAMYSDGLLTRAQALTYLEGLGYDKSLGEDMLKLADFKRDAKATKLAMDAVEAQLKAHLIDQDKAIGELEKAGLDHAQAQAYTSMWLKARKVAIRTLTEAQTLKATIEGIITVEDCRSRLIAFGLSTVDIDILFKLEGLEKFTPLKNVVV